MHAITRHMFDITYHLSPDIYRMTCDYHISRTMSCYSVLHTVTCILSTYVLLLLM